MKGDRVPDKDHIARQCGGANVHEDGTIDGAAFRLRERPDGWEEYLSVNWLEHLGPADRLRQLEILRQVFLDWLDARPPEYLTFGAASLVLTAFSESWPCKAE